MADFNSYDARYERVTRKFLKSSEWRRMRKLIFQALGKKCRKCGANPTPKYPTHVDHVIPRSHDKRGIKWLDPANLQPLCGSCNEDKSYHTNDYRTVEDLELIYELKVKLIDEGFDFTYPVDREMQNAFLDKEPATKSTTPVTKKRKTNGLKRPYKGFNKVDALHAYLQDNPDVQQALLKMKKDLCNNEAPVKFYRRIAKPVTPSKAKRWYTWIK